MFPFSSHYKKLGILGINARNSDYIFPNNPRRLYPLVDDKLETKQLAEKAGIQTPELYAVIDSLYDVRRFRQIIGDRQGFVIKPAKGSGGGGITVIDAVTPIGFRKASGQMLTDSEMRYYLSNIISGMYSMGGQPDRIIIEYTVQFDPIFKDITFQGVPDIRVLLYKGVPAMAMLRLPTRASDGKANLHMGGIGVGINMANGQTLHGVQFGKPIDIQPETGHPIAGYTIPGWEGLLEMASRFYDITGLGYVGVDLVLDEHKGPMLLEVNARPGIAIQSANRCGLKDRLNKIDSTDKAEFFFPASRAEFAMRELGE